MAKITKAVIPAAGLGTRFLPATKAMPKEMLPVVDKPVMQYVVEEAVGAGLNHILMITGRNKNALENHFDRAFELETLLDEKGDRGKLTKVLEPTELADIHYVRQGDPLGLGHAVLKAQTFIGDEPFALLLGDEIIDDGDQLLEQMITAAETHDASVVALMEVPDEQVSKYGIADIGLELSPGLVSIKNFVEKPALGAAPSNYAIIGRYVLQPEIFELIRNQAPGFGGEIQLTDSLSELSQDNRNGTKILGLIFKGTRHDTGDKLSFLKATVEIASTREDLGLEFQKWLKAFVRGI